MPIVYDAQAMYVQLVWESANFASGAGTSSFGLYTDANGATALNAVATGISQAWQTTMRAVTDTDCTLDFIRWETQTFSGEVSVGLAGSLSVTGTPPNTSVLFTFKAAEKGPRNRGRIYWPQVLPEASVDERGIITPALVTTLNTTMGNFFNAVTDLPNVLGHYIPQSEYPGQQSPPNLPWPQVITRGTSAIAATQRRRLRR